MSQTNVVTGKVRMSYANVFEAKAIGDGGDKKYSVCLLVNKNDAATLAKIDAAVKAAIVLGKEKFGQKWGTSKSKPLKLPLRDGDDERGDNPEYADNYFLNAAGQNRPGVVDKDRNEILDKEEFYSGCYGRASINFYPFDVSGNQGIACGLNNVQKLADGEPLSGGRSAADDFADEFEEDDYDPLMQ